MAEKEKSVTDAEVAEVPVKDKADKVRADKAKAAKKKPKKEKKGWFRGTWGELKKVTWPGFGATVKQTGIVIGVTVCFLVVVTLMDLGLGAIYKSLLELW